MAVTLPFKVTLILYFKVLGSYETGGGAPYAYDGLGAGSSFFAETGSGYKTGSVMEKNVPRCICLSCRTAIEMLCCYLFVIYIYICTLYKLYLYIYM